MTHPTRRSFLQGLVAATAGVGALSARSGWSAAADRINLASVGVGGKGWSDLHETSVGQNVVAICDVDSQRLEKAAAKFPKARKYTDWRKLMEQKDIDAVTVSTPDHMHAPISMAAMNLGRHVYCQKPLTHSVFEARRLAEEAAAQKVVTQMGIQHHATARLKIAVQIIRDGVIGKVQQVHSWTDRPGRFWKQGLDRPNRKDPVPTTLAWDQWLGVAPTRPFVAGLYHPFHWRGWWDFGTGALGDMGCHILDPVVNALELGPPRTIRAQGPKPHPESGPTSCVVHYTFPGTKHTSKTLKLTWYEAGKQPPRELFQAPDDWKGSANAVLMVGEKGNLFFGFPEMPKLFPEAAFADYKMPELQDHNHYQQWTSAILGKTPTSCPFSYSGPLTETVLLGNVAYRSGKTIRWDHAALQSVGMPEANQFLGRRYRKGWEVDGLGGESVALPAPK